MINKSKETLYGVIRQRINNLSKTEHFALIQMCHIAKNLYNQALYNIRQYFFQQKGYLRYETNYHLLKDSKNYKLLNSSVAQQIIKKAHNSFESFLAILKQIKQKKLLFEKQLGIPKYLAKNSLYPLHIIKFNIKDNKFTIPLSAEGKKHFPKITIRVPKIIKNLNVKEIKIIPIAQGKWFEIHYVYEIDNKEKINTKSKNALGIKLGVDNLATCTDTNGNSFIIDGKPFKQQIQRLNKEIIRLKSIYTKQGIKIITKKLAILQEKRKNIIKDYMHKTAKIIVNYCLKNNISYIVIGYNSSNFHKFQFNEKNNKNIFYVPFNYLIYLIKHKCKKYGIYYIEVDETYISQASAIDKDPLPSYHENIEIEFSGKIIEKNLYLTKDGKVINADVNSSLNILRKAGFELNFSHIPVPRRYQVWGNGSMPYLVGAACEPASVDKAGTRPANSTESSIL